MIFDKREETKALISAFDDDAIESVSAAAGSEGASSAADTSRREDITAIYKALKNVTIGEELKGDAVSAGGGCLVSFIMDDGTECDFTFGSSEVYELNGKYYAASGTETLWNVIQSFAEK